MGNKRDLSDETFQYILGNIEKRNSDDGWFDYGFCGHHLWGHTNLESDMSNVKDYLLDLADEEDKSKKQITDIKSKVFDVEKNYTAKFKQNTRELIALANITKKMANSICISDFKTSFNINSLKNNILPDKVVLMNDVDYKKILAKKSDEITPEEYQKVARLLLTTKDPQVVKDIITGCFDQYLEINNSYFYKPNMKKFQSLHSILQENTCSLIAVTSYSSDKDKIEALHESGLIYDAIQRTQLLESLMAYFMSTPSFEILEIPGDENHPNLSINVDHGNYIVKYYKTIPTDKQIGAIMTTELNYEEMEMTISKPGFGDSADESNKNETVNYTIAVTGLNSDAAWGDAANGALSTGSSAVIDYASRFAPGIGKAKFAYDVLDAIFVEPYKKEVQLQNFKRVTDASKAGTVADSFNLIYTSTDINGDIKKHSYTLYPSAAHGDTKSSKECIENFNKNLFENEKFDKERKSMSEMLLEKGIDQGIDINYVLTNPKETGEILYQLNVYLKENNHSLDELTDTPYNPQKGR